MIQEFNSLQEAIDANSSLPLLKAGLLSAECFKPKPFQSWEFLFKKMLPMIAGKIPAKNEEDGSLVQRKATIKLLQNIVEILSQ